MDEDTIWMVYTRYIPGIYQKIRVPDGGGGRRGGGGGRRGVSRFSGEAVFDDLGLR